MLPAPPLPWETEWEEWWLLREEIERRGSAMMM